MRESNRISDFVIPRMDRVRESGDNEIGIWGFGEAVLTDINGIIIARSEFSNLVTDKGDQYYGERAAAGIAGSPLSSGPNQVTGMKLGTSSTAVAKTGAGAALVGYLAASQQALVSGFPTSSQPGGAGTARQIQWQSLWAAGVATTGSAITEVVMVIDTLADATSTAANTICRALLTGISSKGASDTLTVTWNHNLLGA